MIERHGYEWRREWVCRYCHLWAQSELGDGLEQVAAWFGDEAVDRKRPGWREWAQRNRDFLSASSLAILDAE